VSERTIDSNLKTESTSPVFNYVVFVQLAFPSGTIYAHNGVGTITWGGNDYLGVGGFGTIGVLEESLALNSNPVEVILSSVTPEIITAIQVDDIFGRDADIFIGTMNEDGELLGTPDNWYSGHMETVALTLGESDGVKIRIQSRASRLRLRNNKRYTIEQHQADHPGDLFFEFLPHLMEASVTWGGERVRIGFASGGGLIPAASSTPIEGPIIPAKFRI